MSNLQQLNALAQEIANALGTIDLDLLKKIHALATGATTTNEAAAAEETAVS
jgi:hypothetical protein